MAFEHSVLGALDYAPCRYGGSGLVMRGPLRRVTDKTIVCLGGTETFGKFVPDPFPALIPQFTGVPCANFGVVNAGVDTFARDAAIQKVARSGRVIVLQILGAHTVSNRYFRVHPRRNDRFIGPTDKLRALYPEVDFTEFHFTRALLLRLRQVSHSRFNQVVREMQRAWSAVMDALLDGLDRPVLGLWIFTGPTPVDVGTRMEDDPLFIDHEMLDALALSDVVRVELSPAALAANTRGMVYSPMQAPMAEALLGPAGQCEVAMALAAALPREVS